MSPSGIVAVIDALAVLAFGSAAWLAWRLPPRRLAAAPRLFLCVAMLLQVLVGVSNALEHSGVTDALDPFEDYLEMLFVPFFVFFLIAANLQRQVVRLQQAQALQRQTENHYRVFVEGTGDLICRFRPDTSLTFVNEAYCRYFQKSREELVGKPFLLLVTEEDRARVKEYVDWIVSSRTDHTYEHEVTAPDGSRRWQQWTDMPLVGAAGEVYELQSVGRDITERKRAELERELVIKELAERNAELERFTYTVSHDLKSPLITIRGFLGYIETDAKSGNHARLEQDIQRVNDATGKMQRLLDELLELTRVGGRMNTPVQIPFGSLAQEAVGLVAGRLEQRGIEVTIEPNLPVVRVDRVRILELLQNLLENAIKFMGDQPAPRIAIGARSAGADRFFFVQDNGIGIEPQHRERIFGLFDKLDPNSEGTGVGLALVKRIAELHRGRVWVESDGKGKGSTFCFTLPQAPLPPR